MARLPLYRMRMINMPSRETAAQFGMPPDFLSVSGAEPEHFACNASAPAGCGWVGFQTPAEMVYQKLISAGLFWSVMTKTKKAATLSPPSQRRRPKRTTYMYSIL